METFAPVLAFCATLLAILGTMWAVIKILRSL